MLPGRRASRAARLRCLPYAGAPTPDATGRYHAQQE